MIKTYKKYTIKGYAINYNWYLQTRICSFVIDS